jgi:peroxiredoxin
MATVTSTMLPLGTEAPDFRLSEPSSGKVWSHDDFADAPALLVMFICNHCPYVRHISKELAAATRDFQARGVGVVGINSNDISAYPDDAPERMVEEARAVGYPFPYLFDEAQEVAAAYRAACTPDFFLFDGDRRLAYRGQFDGSRPNNGEPVTGADLRAAVDAVLTGGSVTDDQRPSMGCNIKWKPGNVPARPR